MFGKYYFIHKLLQTIQEVQHTPIKKQLQLLIKTSSCICASTKLKEKFCTCNLWQPGVGDEAAVEEGALDEGAALLAWRTWRHSRPPASSSLDPSAQWK